MVWCKSQVQMTWFVNKPDWKWLGFLYSTEILLRFHQVHVPRVAFFMLGSSASCMNRPPTQINQGWLISKTWQHTNSVFFFFQALSNLQICSFTFKCYIYTCTCGFIGAFISPRLRQYILKFHNTFPKNTLLPNCYTHCYNDNYNHNQ